MVGIGLLEVFRGDLRQPLRVDGAHFSHVLLRCLHELVVDDPLWALVEQRRTRMNVDLLIVGDGLIAFGWVFTTAVVEEAGDDGLPDLRVVLHVQCTARDDRQSESFHDRDQLLPHVLGTLQCSGLYEIVVAPRVLAAVELPRLVYREQGQVIAVFVVELRALLVCEILLLAWPVEDVLD